MHKSVIIFALLAGSACGFPPSLPDEWMGESLNNEEHLSKSSNRLFKQQNVEAKELCHGIVTYCNSFGINMCGQNRMKRNVNMIDANVESMRLKGLLFKGVIDALKNDFERQIQVERRIREQMEKEVHLGKGLDEANDESMKLKAVLFEKLITELKDNFEREKREDKQREIRERERLEEEHLVVVQALKEKLKKVKGDLVELETLRLREKQHQIVNSEKALNERREVERLEKLLLESKEQGEKEREQLVKEHAAAIQLKEEELRKMENSSMQVQSSLEQHKMEFREKSQEVERLEKLLLESKKQGKKDLEELKKLHAVEIQESLRFKDGLLKQILTVQEEQFYEKELKEKKRVEKLMLENMEREKKARDDLLEKHTAAIRLKDEEFRKKEEQASKQTESLLAIQEEKCKEKEEKQRVQTKELLSDVKKKKDLERQQLEEKHSASIELLEGKLMSVLGLLKECRGNINN